jgi:hypothetical protein
MVVRHSFVSFAAAAVFAASTASAQDVDFSRIPGVNAEPTVQIDLRTGVLSFVSAMAGATDPSLAEALAGLERVRVFVYSAVDDRDALASFVDTSAQRLERSGYERTVVAEEGTSKVRVHTKAGATRLEGITLMVLEGEKEAVFIDIAGDIDPAQLGKAMAKLGVNAGVNHMVGAMGSVQPPQPAPPAVDRPQALEIPAQPAPPAR